MCRTIRAIKKFLKNWGLIFFPTKHKSSHNLSTRHFDDKVTSDLDFLAHLAPKNNIVSFSLVLCTPWMSQWPPHYLGLSIGHPQWMVHYTYILITVLEMFSRTQFFTKTEGCIKFFSQPVARLTNWGHVWDYQAGAPLSVLSNKLQISGNADLSRSALCMNQCWLAALNV